MRVFVGIDLGSTTTKAIVLGEDGNVIGRGITNSRSNYDVACNIAREEAFVRTRFTLTRQALASDASLAGIEKSFLPSLERNFRLQQHLRQLERLREALLAGAEGTRYSESKRELIEVVEGIVAAMAQRAQVHFGELAVRKSDFFRDLAAADYMHLAEERSNRKGIAFDKLCGLFDAAILVVENESIEEAFERHIGAALDRTLSTATPAIKQNLNSLRAGVEAARAIRLVEAASVGTGYGRQRLPFPKEQIRSEILCHGLGAHAMFPGTRTVLDIGGQDTKAIQVDAEGIVTSFQMNDRCAAGCGRYLGYIADEMNLGIHELGPLAQ